MPPASAATAAACSSTACSSSASTSAVSTAPPGGTDLPGDRLELRRCAAGEEDPGALAGERASNGAADRPAPSVDHGVLVLEQHVYLLKSQLSQRRSHRRVRSL